MLIYIAGPIDYSHGATALFELRNSITRELLQRKQIATFDPTKPFTNAGRSPEQAYRINQYALQQADAVLALLPPDIPTVGTPMEIKEAHDAAKPVAVLGGERSMQLIGMGVERFDLDQAAAALSWLELSVNGGGPPRRGQPLKWTGDPGCKPIRHYDGDAGWDLVVKETTRIPYGEFVDVPCGISVELPEGVWAMITGRSSTLRKRQLLVTTGIIDNGYTGPLYAGVQNVGPRAVSVEQGERIAQLIPFPQIARDLIPWQVEVLEERDRGASGFGSTGV